MKHVVKDLVGCKLGATDGEIGDVKEVYFEDDTWTVRYLVVDTGSWLLGRKVLISPHAISDDGWDNKIIPVNLTKEQVRNSPDIDTEKPVERQQEIELYGHYGWPYYWGGGIEPGALWAGGIGTTGMMMGNRLPVEEELQNRKNNRQEDDANNNPHLRSTDNVKGYNIVAKDGKIGEVDDFIIDDSTWKIHYLIVDTGNWFPGKKVLVSPRWIKEVEWETSSVTVNVTIDSVKNSPEYDPNQQLREDYETRLNNHYGNHISTA
jgi:uncharacterized protein YrrD